MSQKIIVTPGNLYVDIDGLACAIVYAELLRTEDKDATAVFVGNFNASIPPSVAEIAKSYQHTDIQGDEYVFVDISTVAIIEEYVGIEKVVEIYDHHTGYEDFWRERLGTKSIIEPIGAAATLIYEEWKKRNHPNNMSTESATLLAHAILSNTVNFQLALTSHRDKQAYRELVDIAGLENNWAERYFLEQQSYIESNPRFAIENDIKSKGENYAFGQLEIWDSQHIMEVVDFGEIFREIGFDTYFMNLVDIKGGYSRVVSNREDLIVKLADTLHLIPNTGEILHLPKLMLRKEIYPILKNE